MLDSRPRSRGFESRRRHCVVLLSKTHLSLLSAGSTQEDPSRHNRKIVDWDVKNQIKIFVHMKNAKHLYLLLPIPVADPEGVQWFT